MEVEIIEVKSRRSFVEFINVPSKIHKGHKNWVPPIYMDDRQFFNAKKNRSFKDCDTIMLIAKKDRVVVGRIMGIISHKYNQKNNKKDARFCFMETYNDQEVANKLISEIEKWAKSKNINQLIGPLAFSDKDPQGMLIEGFDEVMVIATNCNFPYQVDLLEKMGFSKKIDLVVYRIKIPDEIPEVYKKVYDRGIKNNGVHILELKTRKQLKPYIRPILQLMNETFKDIYAFNPMDEKEMDEFANRYLFILNPRFIKVGVNKNNEVVSFVIAMPDISEGIIACKGRVIPFGIFKILRSQKKTKQLNLLLGGIRQDYRNKGLDAMMGLKMTEEAHKTGLKYIDSHLELETNVKMRAEMERLGGEIYKRYRIYKKDIL